MAPPKQAATLTDSAISAALKMRERAIIVIILVVVLFAIRASWRYASG